MKTARGAWYLRGGSGGMSGGGSIRRSGIVVQETLFEVAWREARIMRKSAMQAWYRA